MFQKQIDFPASRRVDNIDLSKNEIHSVPPQKKLQACIMTITTLYIHQIHKVRSVSKSVCSQLYKTNLIFFLAK